MSVFYTVLEQIGTMYLLMIIGFVLYRRKMLDDHGTAQISNLPIWFWTPG